MNSAIFNSNYMKHLYLLFFLLNCGTLLGQLKLTQKQISKLDSIATQDVPSGAPGIATAIISQGKLIYEKYAGFENLEDSLKLDTNSRFNLASIGKQFTALAILLLEQQSKLNLSDDIRKYLPGIYKNFNGKITIQNLLNHTSGIRDVYDLWSLQGLTWWQQTYDNDEVMALVKAQKDLNYTPGSKYLYSNTNYILLAEIIERVTKKSFVDFTKEMFSELNMDETSFEDDFTNIEGPIAKPYFNFDTWSNYDWKWNAVGDGNFFSTLADQIEWEKTVQGYGNPRISREIINRSQLLDNNNFQYGFGLEFGDYKGLSYRYHEGATGAWKATVVRFEKENLSIITLTNSGKTIPSMQTRQMVDVIFNLKDSAEYLVTQPEKVGSFVSEDEILGVYLTPNNFSFEFKINDSGNLVLSRIGRGETELVREADNIFHQKYDPAFKQEFTKNENGEMVVTAYYTTHAPYCLTNADSNWANYDYKSLNGTYNNQETGVELNLKYDNHKNYLVSMNGQENKGILVTPSKLLVNNYVIEFDIKYNDISTLFLSADRIENVKFKREAE